MDIFERFTQKIAEPFDAHNDCWVWTAGKNHKGYGKFRLYDKTTSAHRAAYQLFVGPIPVGYHVDHLCKNRVCVRPDHLQAITHFENSGQGRRSATHCTQGHEYSELNTYYRRDGARQCRTCRRDWERIYKRKKKYG